MSDFKMLIIFFFLSAVGMTTGILVGPVRLGSMEQYIDYRSGASEETSLIECPVKLEGSEELKEVSWILYEGDNIVGRYFWNPGSGGKGEGLLQGVVRLDREDGHLQLTELRYDLAGFYSCSATTVEEVTDEAAKWEVLIIDMMSKSKGALEGEGPCKFSSVFRIPEIFPEATLHSGLYSDSLGGFFEEVRAVDWHKQAFPNKSFSYFHEDVIFEINDKTPQDVYFLNNVGILKTDGTYISLLSVKTVMHEFEERGCPPVKVGAYQTVVYSNGGKTTCRGEILPPTAGKLMATVQCINGYKPEDAKGRQSMELGCSTKSWEWGIPNDYPSVGHIKCVVDDAAYTASASSLLLVISLLILQVLQQ